MVGPRADGAVDTHSHSVLLAGDAQVMRLPNLSSMAVQRARRRHDPIPRATRLRTARWRDLRLWAGLTCIVIAMFAGAALLSRDDSTITVWQAARDLAPGAAPEVIATTVALDDAAGAYIPASEPITGLVVTPVAQGALVPRSAIGVPDTAGTRLVTIPVDPLHAPLGLTAGVVVDVWATPTESTASPLTSGAGGASTPTAQLVLASVLVHGAASDDLGRAVPVVLEVPEPEAQRLISAARTGVIDLVLVPMSAWDAQPEADSQITAVDTPVADGDTRS